jgi:succinylglutamate desuccinylase
MKTNPRILITAATHGDEKVGLYVKKELKKLSINKGKLNFMVVNELALKKKKRFIDTDLNRSFPGNPKGGYEEKLAYKLAPKIKEYDLVIDIHSTTSDLKDALIITKLNKATKEVIKIINPKYLLYMNFSKKHALISNAKVGIAFEYGKDESKKALNDIVFDIKKVLTHYEMIDEKINLKKKDKIKSFEINKTLPKKEGDKINPKITNYKFVRKGQTVAINGKTKIKASENFYPILFGQKNYETMFGFVGKKFEL